MIISRLEFIHRVQIDQDTLQIWIEEEWLIPNQVISEMEFSEADIARAALILDLKKGLGVNDEGVGVVLHLIDQMHGLRKMVGGLLPTERDDHQA
ncbi:MAG: chaperone modulator CbpM [Allorhizobium sp.]